MKRTLLHSGLLATVFIYGGCTAGKIELPPPHKNFIGKWSRNDDIAVVIAPDKIRVYAEHALKFEIPDAGTTEIKVVESNDSTYKIRVEEGASGLPMSHPFTFNRKDNTIRYGDKILSKEGL